MLFAKLLGRLRGKRERALQPSPVVNITTKPSRAPPAGASDKDGAGFDPYNSGSFNAKPWERIKRR
jgi:hypothetical protein